MRPWYFIIFSSIVMAQNRLLLPRPLRFGHAYWLDSKASACSSWRPKFDPLGRKVLVGLFPTQYTLDWFLTSFRGMQYAPYVGNTPIKMYPRYSNHLKFHCKTLVLTLILMPSSCLCQNTILRLITNLKVVWSVGEHEWSKMTQVGIMWVESLKAAGAGGQCWAMFGGAKAAESFFIVQKVPGEGIWRLIASRSPSLRVPLAGVHCSTAAVVLQPRKLYVLLYNSPARSK